MNLTNDDALDVMVTIGRQALECGKVSAGGPPMLMTAQMEIDATIALGLNLMSWWPAG